MNLIVTCIHWLLLVLALQVLVTRICARQPALWPHRNYLAVLAILWCSMAIAKKCYFDDILPPSDALEHEAIARDFSQLFRDGRIHEAVSHFSVGNPAYQLFAGVFYAFTGASEVVLYTVNGALGFWGLLGLLDILCRHTGCSRMPVSVVTVTLLLPSPLFWATTNLKEGPVLWGICMMLYLTVPASHRGVRSSRVLPMTGLLVTALLRPHIAAAWLLAIAAGAMVERKRIGLFAISGTGVLASIVLLGLLAPQLFEKAARDGLTTTLAERYDTLSINDRIGGSNLTGNTPIPVVSGLVLILFRPWPGEVHGLGALLVGLEMWGLAALGLLHWIQARPRLRLLMRPAIVTSIVALLLLGFYFSYMYNMGLVVRQRVMCFPAILSIYTWPLLARQGVGIGKTLPLLRSRLRPRRPATMSPQVCTSP
ncbi:MAG: hypothetical protein ACC628_06725 [Pirellulaceae bacterium]